MTNTPASREDSLATLRESRPWDVLIIGGGDAWPVLERMVKEHELEGRVRMMGKMPYARMMAYTRNADLGLTLDKDTNLNYRFSLPNKLFDYLNAGLPVLATDLPEVAGIVREFDCGSVIKEPTPEAIAGAVREIFINGDRLRALLENATFAARKLDGEQEAAKLRALLEHLG